MSFNFLNVNKMIRVLFAGVLLITLNCCGKKTDNTLSQLDHQEFIQNIIDEDIEALRKQIDAYFINLEPKPTEIDEEGNKDHFDRFVLDLEQCPEVSIEFECYRCVKTLPPISEVCIK